MQMLSFVKVMYDISDNVMKVPDDSRPDDFISISGTKMRLLARNGASLCPPDNIPSDLEAANCIPSGFMVPKGWDGVVDYYRNANDKERWVPWSKPHVAPYTDAGTSYTGAFGTTSFVLKHVAYTSWWHSIPLYPEAGDEQIINFIVEIPMYVTAKMEVNKELPGNVIMQDVNKDGSARHYTYGVPFFNYGLIPQTWEDPELFSPLGFGGDNDPLDVMEVGSGPLPMGSINPCRILGSLELIDEGETDHKVVCIVLSDPDASRIHSIADLEVVKPGVVDNLVHWLKRYKTSDGKGENSLAQEMPTTTEEAIEIVKETNMRWKKLCWEKKPELGFSYDGC